MFTSFDFDRAHAMASRGQALGQAFGVKRANIGIGHDDCLTLTETFGDQRASFVEQARADQNVIGPGAKIDVDHLPAVCVLVHCAPF